MFKAGDKVRRIRSSFLNVTVGEIYEVAEQLSSRRLRLIHDSQYYDPECFELVVETAATKEADPTGRDPHQAGAKLDAGKAEFDYVLGYFPKALAAVNEVADYGAKKYTPGGWVTVPDGVKRYSNAGVRHRIARMTGESHDKDTKLLHAAHEAWNALAVLELLLKEQA